MAGAEVNTTHRVLLKKLKQLDDEFSNLYRQKRYPEALRAARKTLQFAEETLEQGYPYRDVFKKHTPTGVVQITYREHSVLLTGFDREYVFYNDPLVNIANNKTGRESFQAAWEHMGKQAVTYLPH